MRACNRAASASVARLTPPPRRDLESIDALVAAVAQFEGGVVLVSHDARLILETDCTLWVCGNKTAKVFDGDFDDYRDALLEELEEQEANAAYEAELKAAAAAKQREERLKRLNARAKPKK